MTRALTRIVSWGHELLGEVLAPGQLAIDLTAGNGYDTQQLYRMVGGSGQVVAFDIQQEALQMTRCRLEEEGAEVRIWTGGDSVPSAAGVDLVAAGHEHLANYLPGHPHAVIANLGYLPGGESGIITRPQTTLSALRQACTALAAGGRLAVVVYTGHAGGCEEGAAVGAFFAALEQDTFQVLQLKVANRPDAPYLLVAEKRA